MDVMAPYLMFYLLGIATSILIFRQLMRYFVPDEHIEGRLLDLLAVGIFLLIGIVCHVWLRTL